MFPSEQDEMQERRRLIPAHGTAAGNRKRIVLVARSVQHRHRLEDADDLKELVKTECARLHLAYDAEAVGNAVDDALARRARGLV